MVGVALALIVGGWHSLEGTSPDYAAEPRGNGVVVRRVAARTTYAGGYGDAGYAVGIVDPAPFRGRRIVVTQRAARTEATGYTDGYVNVWGPEGLLTADDTRTQHRELGPETTAYSFVLDIPPDATSIEVGIMLVGRGEASVERADIELAGPDAVPTGRPLVTPIDAESRDRVSAVLRAAAHPFAADHEEALAAVARAGGKARIIGIGSNAHGSAAEDARSAEIVRYLALHDDVRVLAVEVMFGTGRRLDAYVNGETVDVDRALRQTNFYAFETVEFRRLLDWMRAENAARPPDRRLHVVGVDMEYWWPQSDFVLDRLRHLDRSSARKARRWYACIDHAVAANAAACLRDARAVSALVRGSFGARGSDEARAARMVEQHLERRLGAPTRDDAIAENVAWAAETRYPGTRLAFWAHLYHVSAACCLGHATAGERLAVRYNDRYYAVALVFGSGTVRAIPDGESVPRDVPMPPPSPNTLESVLDAAGEDYFVDTNARDFDSSAQSWLKLRHRLRRIDLWTDARRPETTWTDERFWNAVDGFIYLRTTTAPELIPGAISRSTAGH
jgi:erythromycin esterase